MHLVDLDRAPQQSSTPQHLLVRFAPGNPLTSERLREAWSRLYTNDWPGASAVPATYVDPAPEAGRRMFLRRTASIDSLTIDLHPALTGLLAHGQ